MGALDTYRMLGKGTQAVLSYNYLAFHLIALGWVHDVIWSDSAFDSPFWLGLVGSYDQVGIIWYGTFATCANRTTRMSTWFYEIGPAFNSHGHSFGVSGVGERYIGALIWAQLSSSLSCKVKESNYYNISNQHVRELSHPESRHEILPHQPLWGGRRDSYTQNGLGSLPEHSVRIQRSHFLRIIPRTLIPFWLDFNRVKGPTTTATVKGVKGLYVVLPKVSLRSTSLIFHLHSHHCGTLSYQIFS